MDEILYRYNARKRKAEDGKFYYYYPYLSACENEQDICKIGGIKCVRLTVSEEEFDKFLAIDTAERNSNRRFYNKNHRTDFPAIFDGEFGEEIDYPNEKVVDEESIYAEETLCQNLDESRLVSTFDNLDKQIYHLHKTGYNQSEIALKLNLNQSTVSRRLMDIFDKINHEKFNDGTRTKEQIEFEVAWEHFLKYGTLPNHEEVDIFYITFLLGNNIMETMYKWFYSPKEFLRYAMRYRMLHEQDTHEQIDKVFTSLIPFHQQFLLKHCHEPVRILNTILYLFQELERRADTLPYPSGAFDKKMKEQVHELAKRRKIKDEYYEKEILARKYDLKRKKFMLAYAQKVLATATDEQIKIAMKTEIDTLKKDIKLLRQEIEKSSHEKSF